IPECTTPLLCPVWWRERSSSFSRTSTEQPGRARTRAMAVARPTMPPPMTHASYTVTARSPSASPPGREVVHGLIPVVEVEVARDQPGSTVSRPAAPTVGVRRPYGGARDRRRPRPAARLAHRRAADLCADRRRRLHRQRHPRLPRPQRRLDPGPRRREARDALVLPGRPGDPSAGVADAGRAPGRGRAAERGARGAGRAGRQGRLRGLVTQNVDGLHQAAGSSAERVLEI